VKRTKRAVNVAMLAACLSTVRCGGDPGPNDSPKPDGGAGGAHADGAGGAAGSGFGGFGGFVIPDSSSLHCPMDRPSDSSPCPMRGTCRYLDAVCTCVRAEGQDGNARVWNCFDVMPRDAATCPHDPQGGDPCMNPGQRCAGGNQGTTCTCEAGDGNLEWHC
jgi:hypothetical protein